MPYLAQISVEKGKSVLSITAHRRHPYNDRIELSAYIPRATALIALSHTMLTREEAAKLIVVLWNALNENPALSATPPNPQELLKAAGAQFPAPNGP